MTKEEKQYWKNLFDKIYTKEEICSLTENIYYSLKEEQLKTYFGEFYPEIEEEYKQYPMFDYIDEMLQSHDADKLIARLQKEILPKYNIDNDSIFKETKGELTNFNIKTDSEEVANKLIEDKDFLVYLKYYNYYITNIDGTLVQIEPKYTDKINDYVFKKCCGQAYHITAKDNVDRILLRGLECRGENKYRKFQPKVFLYASENYKDKKKLDFELLRVANKIKRFGKDWIVLKINFRRNSNGINIYRDASMTIDGTCYTFENIPPSLISVYKPTTDLMHF